MGLTLICHCPIDQSTRARDFGMMVFNKKKIKLNWNDGDTYRVSKLSQPKLDHSQ